MSLRKVQVRMRLDCRSSVLSYDNFSRSVKRAANIAKASIRVAYVKPSPPKLNSILSVSRIAYRPTCPNIAICIARMYLEGTDVDA